MEELSLCDSEMRLMNVTKAITKAYNKQKKSISVPGFRKGKVPQAMIEKMYGAEIFYEDAANIKLSHVLLKIFYLYVH